MNANIITLAEAFTLIQGTRAGKHCFGATFTKKDGSLRTGSFKLGVTKGVKGVGLAFDPAAHSLLSVCDLNKVSATDTGHRFINLKTLQTVTIKREVFTVQG